MDAVTHLLPSKTTLGAAIEAFFADRDLAPATQRAYRATYDRLLETFGADLPIEELTGARLRRWITDRWGQAAPTALLQRMTTAKRRLGDRSSQIAASPKFLSIRRTSPMIPS